MNSSTHPKKALVPSPFFLFFRFTLVTFLVALVTFIGIANFLYQRQLSQHPRVISPALARFPASISDPEIDPTYLRREKEWLAFPLGVPERGMGIRLLENPILFAQVFPGYSDSLRTDQKIWNRYFQHPFDADIWIPNAPQAQDIILQSSWLGCLEIFNRDGADTLIIGNSETARDLIGTDLQRKAFKSSEKLLFCGRNGLLPRNITALLNYLVSTGKHVPRLIVGFSQVWGYPQSFDETGDQVGQAKLLQEFIDSKNLWHALLNFRTKDLFTVPTWDSVAKLSLAKLEKNETQNAEWVERGRIADPYPYGFNFYSDEINKIPELIQSQAAYYNNLRGKMGLGCHEKPVIHHYLNQLADAAQSLASNVYFFRTPVSPLEKSYADPCVDNLINEFLVSRSGSHFFTKMDSSTAYDLDWPDFVRPQHNENVVWLDSNHPNFKGAQKITHRIATWIQATQP